jgi:tetratricopeptide (TPR) repeat protein/transcriptional regulator with XRE-family HTH domain
MEAQRPGARRRWSFGTLLRYHRQAAGLTQEALAERAGIGVRTVRDLERESVQRPRGATVDLLATALALPPADHAAFTAAAHAGNQVAARAGTRTTDKPPLVGRSRELGLLERHLTGEGPSLLVLAGEPGIGKSRLLQEAGDWAAQAGWHVLMGGCSRRGGQEPYAPLLRALQRAISDRAPAQRQNDLHGCAWLVRLLPELAEQPIEPLPNWTLPPVQERRLLFDAVERFLANVAGPAGTLLLLDDLQWAGADALDMLSALAHAPAAPLRMVGAYRDTEVQPQDPLSVLLADLAHARLATQVALQPLSQEEAEQLLDVLLPAAAAAIRERVLQRTGGVPYYLLSCAQGLRHQAHAGAATVVPWDVAHSLRQRVATLPGVAQEILGAVAVAVGRMVQPTLLTAVIGYPEREVLAGVEAAWRARLLVEVDGAYQCAHDLVREVVEADLSMARRVVLHRRMAEALAVAPGDRPIAALAYHYAASGALEPAVRYLEQAGDQAQERHAHLAAQTHYQELVTRLDQLQRDLDAARAREKLGTVLWILGQFAAALPVLQRAAETYWLLGDLERAGRVAAQIGEVYAISGAPHEGLCYLQPIMDALEPTGPSHSLAGLYGVVARLLLVAGRNQEQQGAADRAAALARTVHDAWLLAEATWQQGLGFLAQGRGEEGRRALEEAVRLTAAVGHLDILGRTLGRLAKVACGAGDLVGARAYADRALQTAEQMSNPRLLADSWVKRGDIACVAGQWDDARVAYEHALALISQFGGSQGSAWALLGLAWLAHVEGEQVAAVHYLARTMELAERMSNLPAVAAAQSLWAEGEVLDGHAVAARARLAPLIDRLDLWAQDVITVQTTLAWAQLEIGAVVEAEAMAVQAGARARAASERIRLVDVLRVQALVLTRSARWVEARGALDEGLALTRSIPYPYAEGRLLHVYGRMLRVQDETGPARERLAAALATFRRLGARKDAERTEHLLATLS